MDEFYGRNMPDADFGEADFVPQAQLYGRYAHASSNERGEPFFEGEVSWSETDLVQATARQPGARAWYLLDDAALGQRVRDRTVADMVAAAPTRTDPADLPFRGAAGARVAVRVKPGITHTIGGLRVDERARVLDAAGAPVPGLLAAGADAGGISAGGYASGLAAALVLGRRAAESASTLDGGARAHPPGRRRRRPRRRRHGAEAGDHLAPDPVPGRAPRRDGRVLAAPLRHGGLAAHAARA